MGFFKGLSKTYLVFVNVLVAICGLGVLAGSVYVHASFSDFSSIFSRSGVVMGLIAGGATMLIGLWGCYAATKQNKCMLFLYSIFMLVMIVLYFASGIVTGVYLNKIDPTDFLGNKTKVTKITDKVLIEINSFELMAFNDCCANVFGLEPVAKCEGDDAQWNCIANNLPDELKPEQGFCTFLNITEIDGHKIAADPETGGCGGKTGGSDQFKKDIYDFLESHFNSLMIGAIAVGVAELLCLLFACCLLCSNREEYDEAYRKQLEQQKQAGQLTGTGAPAQGGGNHYV